MTIKACVPWRPSIFQPVFWGIHDIPTIFGAPTPIRIIFPSTLNPLFTAEFPSAAPILENCGPFPVILFAHGQCTDNSNNRIKWTNRLIPLARSGYIVIIPELVHDFTPASGYSLAVAFAWVAFNWIHGALCDASRIGVAGHSFGAATAAELIANHDPLGAVRAYTALAGRGTHLSLVQSLTIPKLFVFGTEDILLTDYDLGAGTPNGFSTFAGNRHSISIADATHWDFVDAGQECLSSPEGGPGPCSAARSLARDVILTFFSKYMAPHPLMMNIPPSLEPPAQADVPFQSYINPIDGFLTGKSLFTASSSCSAKFTWATTNQGSNSWIMT